MPAFKKGKVECVGRSASPLLLGPFLSKYAWKSFPGICQESRWPEAASRALQRQPANLLPLHEELTGSRNKGKTDYFYLDFSQVFNAICHSILTDKLEGEDLDRCTLRPVEN